MGKKVRNLIGILLLVTAVAVTQIPVSDVEAAPTSSASDFQMDGTTLVKYNGTAEDVSISNYVERIEAGAFAGNDNIRHVTVGDSVEVIGSGAFTGCNNLESVLIPDSVKTIGNAAFSGCPSLREVNVGVGLSDLGNGAFAGDYNLSDVHFDSSNPQFTCDEGAIYNKNGRNTLYQLLAGRRGDSYSMPSTVVKIKPYAFWGDYNLEKVSISSNVKEISAYAFSNCKNLKEVNIPYSVKNIDMKAFEDCVRLREIEIPPSVGTIHSTAFDGCTRLEIQAEVGSVANTFAQSLELEDIEVSEYEEAPGTDSVSGNDVSGEDDTAQIVAPVDYYHEVSHMNAMEADEDAAVKGKTRVIGREAFILIDNANATINVGSTGETIGGTPVEDTPTDTVPGLAGSSDAKGGSFPKYTVVDGSVIAAQAYYDDDMTSFDIPDGIVRIGEFSFARSSLQSVQIPNGVEEIGYAAFYHCDGLTNVVIPNSVRNIAASAFAATPWLSEWKQSGSGDFLIVGDGIVLAYKGSGGVVSIPSGVKQIGAEVFRNNKNVTGVILPDSVEVIGEAAFENCSNLTSIEGGNHVKEVRDRAYAGCPINTVHIPEAAQKIGLRAYDSTGTQKATGNGVIVFEAETIPQLSYEDASTKVYREDYRDLAFKGNMIAVVPESVSDLADTVLDDAQAGFNGVICKMTKEAAGGEDGTLRIVGRRGFGSLPAAGETCTIDGMTYVLEAGTDELGSGVPQEEVREGIDVRINSYSLPQDGMAGAVMEGSEENYVLTITDSEEAKAEIGDVYKKIYGNRLPHNLCAYEVSMTDAQTGVPISGLGKQSVEVTLPIPKGVGEDNMHVVCLDADGQLEEVESRVVSVDGMDALMFSAKHFSYYGIYNYGNSTVVADVQDGQAVFASLGKKDASPDTGDYSIHPKWFFSAGMVCTAMALFFYRGGNRRRRKIK